MRDLIYSYFNFIFKDRCRCTWSEWALLCAIKGTLQLDRVWHHPGTICRWLSVCGNRPHVTLYTTVSHYTALFCDNLCFLCTETFPIQLHVLTLLCKNVETFWICRAAVQKQTLFKEKNDKSVRELLFLFVPVVFLFFLQLSLQTGNV